MFYSDSFQILVMNSNFALWNVQMIKVNYFGNVIFNSFWLAFQLAWLDLEHCQLSIANGRERDTNAIIFSFHSNTRNTFFIYFSINLLKKNTDLIKMVNFCLKITLESEHSKWILGNDFLFSGNYCSILDTHRIDFAALHFDQLVSSSLLWSISRFCSQIGRPSSKEQHKKQPERSDSISHSSKTVRISMENKNSR